MAANRVRSLESDGLRYLVRVPAPGSSGPVPVLCFLHGYDEGAPTPLEDGLTRHGPLRPGAQSDASAEFLVIAPQLPAQGDIWRRYAALVQRIVASARATYGGDTCRTALAGFSFGGNGVFDLASAQPGFWSALWAVDPTRPPARRPDEPVWLSLGSVTRRGKSAFVGVLDAKAFDPDAAPGRAVYLDEGDDHVGCATRAFGDSRIYAWLSRQSRSG